jgi:hypothetical protein
MRASGWTDSVIKHIGDLKGLSQVTQSMYDPDRDSTADPAYARIVGYVPDDDPDRPPYTTTGRHDIPTEVAAMWKRYGFAWGGDYSGPKRDWMQFEFMGTPADAVERTRAALTELASGSVVLRRGSRGPAVAALQARLNQGFPDFAELDVDGVYGSGTESVVAEFQRRRGLPADGVADTGTLAALGLT